MAAPPRPNEDLEAQVRFYLKASISAKTSTRYDKQWDRWTEFCANHGFTPLPGSPRALAQFLAKTASDTESVAVVRQALAAIKERHVRYDETSPTENERVLKVVRGIECKHTKPVKQAPPMTANDMRRIMQFHLGDNPGRPVLDTLRAWRTIFRMRLCHTGLLRSAEVMNLQRRDLAFKECGGEEYLEVTIRSSKTDRPGKGDTRKIPAARDKTTCMVELARRYLDIVKKAPHTSLQQGIVKVGQGAKFSGKNICVSTATKDRKWVLEQAGIETAFTEHSGRRGGAVAIYNAGGSRDDVKRAGNWASDKCAEHYVNGAVKRTLEVAKKI